jgi:hypothetical protein
MTMEAYSVLGVAPGATVAEIKAAYRERARVIHPDRFADDPRRALAAHEAFVELSAAFRSALGTSAALAQEQVQRTEKQQAQQPARRSSSESAGQQSERQVPGAQRPGGAGSARVQPEVPRQRRTVSPARETDPMLTLLTLPQRCARSWSAQALEVWALTVVPEARQHVAEARKTARAAGVSSERHLTTATAHVLLTRTVNGLNGPRVIAIAGQLDGAYDALEIVLPREVVDRLPLRLTARRASDEVSDDEPGRALLAFCAAAGALAAATAWTQLFGFFAG